LDFDDTLCLSEESCFNFENQIAVSMGLKPMSRTIHQITWGQNLKDAIKERVPGIDNEEFMKRFEEQVPDAIQNGTFDNVPERNIKVLDELKNAGKKLAVVTSRSFGEVKFMMDKTHPLSSRIDMFYHRDNSEHLKPDPRVFNKALYEFDVAPFECVYVGDTLKDGFATKEAGMEFIAVLESGLVSKEAFKNVNIPVDFYAQKFTDILPYILSH
jgi:HAD superfamily hydrolase (TIGR01549 family)